MCLERFDEDARRPRCLSCGHTTCTACVQEIIDRKGVLECPYCRVIHLVTVESASQTPVNYTVINLLREEASGAASQTGNGGVVSKDLLQCVKRETSDTTTAHITSYTNNLVHLEQFLSQLQGISENVTRAISSVPLLTRAFEETKSKLVSEQHAVKKVMDEGRTKIIQLRKIQTQVNSVTNTLELTTAHQAITECHNCTQHWISTAQSVINSETITMVKEVRKLFRLQLY